MRTSRRTRFGAVVAAALLVGACSGGDDADPPDDDESAPATTSAEEVADTTEPPVATEAPTTEVPPATDAPDTTEPPSTTDPADDPGDAEARAALTAAFADLSAGGGFRTTVATAQTLRLPILGIDSVAELDPDRPTVLTETSADGSVYQYVDLGPTFTPLFAGQPDLAAQVDEVHVELWLVGDRLTIDATGYQPIADLNPTAPLGPIEPGVGVVDLASLGEQGGEDLVVALAGNSVDPVTLAATLPDSLTGIAQDPNDPTRFTARVAYGDLLTAQGADPEVNAGAVAASLAPSLGVEVGDLAAFYADFFETVDVDVELTVVDGALRSLATQADLSGVYAALFEETSFLVEGATEAERAEAAELFADAEQTVDTLTTFEVDDSIVVTAPEGDFEDRTQAALDFLSSFMG